MSFESMSPADIRAVVGDEGFGNGNNGFWWIIILFLLCGWGRGGYGAGGGDSVRDYLQTDVATLERKMDSITNGLCDGFYTNAQLINGVNQNITNAQINEMQNANAIQAQLAQCCCGNKAAIADVKYEMGSGFCQTNYNNSNNTRDIIANQDANARAILDALNKQALDAKDQRIAEQAQMISSLQLSASQARQNEYIIDRLQPKMPIPAFSVPNPYSYNGCGCNCGC